MKKSPLIRAALFASISIGAFAALPSAAMAQDETAADEDNGEIIVTARRREESLQDVPIAVTAFSGEALEARGAIDITDIGQLTPNTTLETSRGTNSTLTAFIRGGN